MNGSWIHMPMGGLTFVYGSGESTTDKLKREDKQRSRAAIPRRRYTRKVA